MFEFALYFLIVKFIQFIAKFWFISKSNIIYNSYNYIQIFIIILIRVLHLVD